MNYTIETTQSFHGKGYLIKFLGGTYMLVHLPTGEEYVYHTLGDLLNAIAKKEGEGFTEQPRMPEQQVYQYGKYWYMLTGEYRKLKLGERFLFRGFPHDAKFAMDKPHWIMREIPPKPPATFAADGVQYRCDAKVPVKVTDASTGMFTCCTGTMTPMTAECLNLKLFDGYRWPVIRVSCEAEPPRDPVQARLDDIEARIAELLLQLAAGH